LPTFPGLYFPVCRISTPAGGLPTLLRCPILLVFNFFGGLYFCGLPTSYVCLIVVGLPNPFVRDNVTSRLSTFRHLSQN
jgi:hypothetical protein